MDKASELVSVVKQLFRLQIIFILLKIFGLLTINWWWTLTPMFIVLSYFFTIIFAMIVGLLYRKYKMKSRDITE